MFKDSFLSSSESFFVSTSASSMFFLVTSFIFLLFNPEVTKYAFKRFVLNIASNELAKDDSEEETVDKKKVSDEGKFKCVFCYEIFTQKQVKRHP